MRVGISEFRVARAPAVLATHGLGSCLGIILYDPRQKIGGLAHAMLPVPRGDSGADRPCRFIEPAIRLMLDELIGGGAARESLWAKLVGGANMFAGQAPPEVSIGTRNIAAARRTLEALSIPLVGEAVGGQHGRAVELNLETGQVQVHSHRERDRLLLL